MTIMLITLVLVELSLVFNGNLLLWLLIFVLIPKKHTVIFHLPCYCRLLTAIIELYIAKWKKNLLNFWLHVRVCYFHSIIKWIYHYFKEKKEKKKIKKNLCKSINPLPWKKQKIKKFFMIIYQWQKENIIYQKLCKLIWQFYCKKKKKKTNQILWLTDNW